MVELGKADPHPLGLVCSTSVWFEPKGWGLQRRASVDRLNTCLNTGLRSFHRRLQAGVMSPLLAVHLPVRSRPVQANLNRTSISTSRGLPSSDGQTHATENRTEQVQLS